MYICFLFTVFQFLFDMLPIQKDEVKEYRDGNDNDKKQQVEKEGSIKSRQKEETKKKKRKEERSRI